MPEALQILFVVFSGLLGACVGSFLNVCIYRLPRDDLSVNRPVRSFCPTCGHAIAWFDNLPLLSWLALGGRCRACRAPIASRYLIVEALTATFFVIVARRYLCGDEANWGAYFSLLSLITALIVASFIDLDLRILPDEITVGGMIVAPFVVLLVPELHTRPVDGSISWGLVSVQTAVAPLSASLPATLRLPAVTGLLAALVAGAGAAAGVFGYSWYWSWTRGGERRPLRAGLLGGVLLAMAGATATVAFLHPETILSPRMYALWAAFAGMAAGSGLVFLVGVIGTRMFRKPAMGFGDVKLMGLLGAFTGWGGVIVGFFVACFLGSVIGIYILVRYRSRYLPFGPFLALGCLATILWPEALRAAFDWYLSWMRV